MELVKDKRKLSTNTLLGILFLLMLGDYLLTYWGLHEIRIVEEANPIMVRFLELPLLQGIIIRIVYSFILISVFKFVEKYKDPIVFRRILLVPLGMQVVPYVGHVLWFYKYLCITSHI